MIVVDAENAVLGRLGTFVAKNALKGEEIAVVNSEKAIITGNKGDIEEHFKSKRKRVGTKQTGPKHSRLSHLIVKRAIRGMLPRVKWGRGRDAFKRIKCYVGVPKEYENSKKISLASDKIKFITVKEISLEWE